MYLSNTLKRTVLALAIAPFLLTYGQPAALAASDSQSANSKKTSVLLISVDTLRADKVGVYGNKSNLTPNIDQLAKGSVMVTNFITHAPWTRGSFGTLFTSLYPSQHEGEQNMQAGFSNPLNGKTVTMAEIMKGAGYDTAAFQSNGNAGENHGFVKGWNTWQGKELIDEKSDLPYAPANVTYDAFAKWFNKRKNTPYFAWVNFMDAHMPYSPPAQFAKGVVDGNYKGPVNVPFGNYRLARTGSLTKKDKEYIESLYDAEIRYSDEYIGRIIKLLKDSKTLDNTVVIITADHGEEFWDHGRKNMKGLEDEHDWGFGHGQTLFDELVRVPFIIRYPTAFGKKDKVTKIQQTLRQVDFLPTVLDLVKVKSSQSAKFMGKSVLNVLNGKDKAYKTPDIFIESVLYGTELKALRTENYKFIYDMETGKSMMFDLNKDPKETKDVSADMPKRAELMKNKLLDWVKETGGNSKAKKSNATTTNGNTEELMKKLGY